MVGGDGDESWSEEEEDEKEETGRDDKDWMWCRGRCWKNGVLVLLLKNCPRTEIARRPSRRRCCCLPKRSVDRLVWFIGYARNSLGRTRKTTI